MAEKNKNQKHHWNDHMSDQENTTKEKGERISKRMDNNKKGN